MFKRRFIAAAAVVAWLPWAALPVPSAALQGGGSLFAFQNANYLPKLVTVDPPSGTLSTVADLSTLANQPEVGPLVASVSVLPHLRGRDVLQSGLLQRLPQSLRVGSAHLRDPYHRLPDGGGPGEPGPCFDNLRRNRPRPSNAGTLGADPPIPGVSGTSPSIAILRVDPTTGAETTVATHVGEVSTGNSWVALDAASHVLYVATLNDLTGAGQLLALDTLTGTLSAGLSLAAPVSGLLYDASIGALFGVTTGTPEDLAQIDPATGTETAIATFGANVHVIDLAIDSASHTVFGVEYNTLTIANNQIVTVDDQTGASSVGAAAPAPINYLAFARVPPSVGSVAPNAGPVTGGTSVTITGTKFTGVTAVNFGTTPAGSYTVDSATQLTATSPAGTGTVDVMVAAADGTSATTSADTFTYGLGPPRAVAASAGDGSATVSWTAPDFDGGSAITSYTVTGNPGGSQTLTCPCTTLQAIVGGLTNGISYTFTVHATNGLGSGPESGTSNAVTPFHRASGPVVGKPIVGDFSGDGKTDLALVGISGVSVAVSAGTAFSAPTTWAPFPFYGTVATLAGDVTGDGKADLVAVNAGQVFVLPSTGTGFGAPAAWSNIAFYGTRGTFLADVNGDGKADLVAVNNTSVWVMLSTGTGFALPMQWSSTPFYGNLSTQIADVTGDGKADLVAINSTSVWVLPSTGTGFGAPAQWSAVPFYGNVQTMLVDANGDGKVDLVALNSTSTWIMTSTGAGFGPPTQWSATPFYGVIATLSGDVSGDHRQDLIAINPTSVWVALSTGTALSSPEEWW